MPAAEPSHAQTPLDVPNSRDRHQRHRGKPSPRSLRRPALGPTACFDLLSLKNEPGKLPLGEARAAVLRTTRHQMPADLTLIAPVTNGEKCVVRDENGLSGFHGSARSSLSGTDQFDGDFLWFRICGLIGLG